MNKYEEAYHWIRVEALMSCPVLKFNSATNVFECTCNKDEHCQSYVALQTLQELVDKETPKKPMVSEKQKIRYVTTYVCPNCKGKFTGTISNYCYHCGQKLDWSGVDE